MKVLKSTCLKWSVLKFSYFYLWLISLRLGEDWLVLISKLWVQQDISSVWNCVSVMQIAFRSISAEINCSASWIHNMRRTLSESRKIPKKRRISYIFQKHLSQTWVLKVGGGGVDLPNDMKKQAKKIVNFLIRACMCERGEGEGCVINRYSYNFTTFMSDGYLTRIVLISRQPDTCTCIKSKPNIETTIIFVTTHMLCNTCTYSYSWNVS